MLAERSLRFEGLPVPSSVGVVSTLLIPQEAKTGISIPWEGRTAGGDHEHTFEI
jgi:hypothetical protein